MSRFRRRDRHLVLVALATLAVHPAAFAIAAVLAIAPALCSSVGRAPLKPAIAAFVVLGAIAQVGSSTWNDEQASARHRLDAAAGQSTNMMSRSRLSHLRGWSDAGGRGAFARPLEDGFWRLERTDPRTGRESDALLAYVQQDVIPDRPHTLSVFYRHDGTSADFELVIRLPDGTRTRPTTIHEPVEPGLYRAHVTFVPDATTERVRALHVAALQGDWARIDFTDPQLEVASSPSSYRPFAARPAFSGAILWWVAIGFSTLLAMAFGTRLADASMVASRPAWGLAVGLAVQAGFAVAERITVPGARADGLFAHPNLLGHVAVVCVGAVWVLDRGRFTFPVALSSGIGLLAVLASESRTALGGLVLLAFLMTLGAAFRRHWLAGIATVLLGGLAVGAIVTGGARFDDAVVAGREALAERSAAWETAFDAFRARPLVGIGHGAFAAYYEEHVPDTPGPRPVLGHAHGIVPALFAEGGIFGVAGFLALWIPLVVALVRRTAWPALGLVGVVLALNVFDYTFYFGSVYLTLLVAIAWSLAAARASQEPDGGSRRRSVAPS